jgi:hypothetical protein
MPVALDFGGTPVSIGELQSGVEDFTISQSAEFAVEHDHQGKHTKPLSALNVVGRSELLGGSILGALLAFGDEFGATLTADTHDLKMADGTPIEEVSIRLQAATPVSVTGLVPVDPTLIQWHLIENGGAATIRFEQNDTVNSTYPFSLPGELDLDLESGGVLFFKWDPHSSVWRCLQSGASMAVVQRGTITFTAGGADTVDAVINPVHFESASVRWLGEKCDAGAAHSMIFLLNDSSVRATRFSTFNGVASVISFEVSGRLL